MFPHVRLGMLSLWLILLLSMLGTTADVFFVEQLEFISNRFNLSADVAGATLMAFGNGAPDVFTAWNAIENASDFSLVLSELLGASIFISTVVLGMVILCGRRRRGVAVDGKPFARDAAMLAFSVFAIAACVLDGRIQLVESGAIFAAYVFYVVYVISHNRGLASSSSSTTTSSRSEGRGGQHEMTSMRDAEGGLDDSSEDEDKGRRVAEDNSYQSEASRTVGLSLRGIHWSSTTSPFSKAVHVIEWPFSILRHLSIPAATFDDWGSARRTVAASSCCGAVFVVALEFVDSPGQILSGRIFGEVPLGLVLLGVGLAFAGVIYLSTSNSSPPDLFVKTVLVVTGFISAVAWLDLLASETVAVLESLGAAAGLSSAIMGCTLLAWGNCIGDAVADTAVARAGNPKAAISSVFNSPLFSQILASGFAAGYYNVFHGALQINLDRESFLSFASITFSISLTSIVCACSGSRLPRSYAFVLFAVYAVYLVASLALEFNRRHSSSSSSSSMYAKL